MALILAIAAVALLLGGCSSPATITDPLIIAHRGGAADAPENTLPAIRLAVSAGVDMVWLSVQISADGVPVLYRPADLSALTDESGPVSSRTAEQLSHTNAGWTFVAPDGSRPYRLAPVGIPTLAEALDVIPDSVRVIIDVKTPDIDPMVPALMSVIDGRGEWSRILFYSTQTDVHDALVGYPQAQVFEARDTTRARLLGNRLSGTCTPPAAAVWIGYDLFRDVTVTEDYTLGSGSTEVRAQMWDDAAVACARRTPGVHIVIFGVTTSADVELARSLHPDAILVDSPRSLATSPAG